MFDRLHHRRIAAICRSNGPPLQQARDLPADQYGLRTMLRVGEVEIKFKIVLEGRIGFDRPGEGDSVCGVLTLTPLDLLASKLLANSDRWRDDSVQSRDLIDMAMMQPSKTLLAQAVAKGETACGDSIVADRHKAVHLMRERPQRLEQCMQAMGMGSEPSALLWAHTRTLEKRLA